MSKHQHHHRDSCDGRAKGTIKQVVHGLADALGIGRGLIIAGFVLGFMFAPLLSGLVFLAAWYWTSHPDSTRRHVEWLAAHAQRATRRLSESAFGHAASYRRPARGPDFDDDTVPATEPRRSHTADELKQRFEALDRRAKRIEEIVVSKEYRLEREFRRIND